MLANAPEGGFTGYIQHHMKFWEWPHVGAGGFWNWSVHVDSILVSLVLGVLFALGPLDALGLTVVIVQAMISAVFFRSLRPGRTDLVTQIAEAVRSPRSPRELAYTRGVCRGWAWLMASLAVNSLALTFLAPPRVWWWWENVCTVAIPLAFAGCEWLFRQWWLRGEEKTSIPRAVKALIHIDYQRLFQV